MVAANPPPIVVCKNKLVLVAAEKKEAHAVRPDNLALAEVESRPVNVVLRKRNSIRLFMAELKTKKTSASVSAFLDTIEDGKKRKDCQELLKIFQEVSKEKPAMWGSSIIGFGSYHYKSERSTQEGDWPLTGFSPRKQNITLYLMSGLGEHKKLLEKIGKHKASNGSCLYIKRLSDIDLEILKELIKASLKVMKERYNVE